MPTGVKSLLPHGSYFRRPLTGHRAPSRFPTEAARAVSEAHPMGETPALSVPNYEELIWIQRFFLLYPPIERMISLAL